MLQLKDIVKNYNVGGEPIKVLKGINLSFEENEFVSILGQSGCGKTTLLNIIGGLDKYTSGDLIIDNISTKNYIDSDWDTYRNNTIGFVFQTYNLIPHLSVLDNVTMALTLSGVSVEERNSRARKALKEVGLDDHIDKRPNQLSGGQMQRVAIARAIVNNPRILLADEPTGALDSTTSIQIMELIKKISKDRLVIMVTHNGEIAEKYSDRIIQLLDGEIKSDSREKIVDENIKVPIYRKPFKKTSMSFFTALKLSFKNLMTKKTRTVITSIAGSIGIVGVALVLAISSGMTAYVNQMQTDTLAGFPLGVSETVMINMMDPSNMLPTDKGKFPIDDILKPFDPISPENLHINKIDSKYIDYVNKLDKTLYNYLSYQRLIEMNLVYKTEENIYKILDNKTIKSPMPMFPDGNKIGWQQLPSNDFLEAQYDILAGEDFPKDKTEVALVVDEENCINASLLKEFDIKYDKNTVFKFEDLLGKEFKLVHNNEFYKANENGTFSPITELNGLYNNENSVNLKITSIIRVKKGSTSTMLSRGIAYNEKLSDFVLDKELDSEIVKVLKANPTKDIFDGKTIDEKTYSEQLKKIGGDSVPTGIEIYPVSFKAKERIKTYLDDYNTGKDIKEQVIYSDMAEILTISISTLINTISVVLASFAGISLVVSTIMIGIITYVSVVERTKEIGILRSIGARKKDISRVFNAETLIVGFVAGLIGVAFTYLLSIPVNLLIFHFLGVENLASLPIWYGIALVVLSMALTLIGGLIPSKIASKKDPVEALRSE